MSWGSDPERSANVFPFFEILGSRLARNPNSFLHPFENREELFLRLRGVTVAEREIEPRQVIAPWNPVAFAIRNGREKLLVPTQSAEELGRNFVFGLDVIGEGVCVADIRDFETRFIDFSPELEVMPLEADVLGENLLVIVADTATGGEGARSLRE